MNPLRDFVQGKGWYHDDESTGFRGYVPALTPGAMRAIAETAGVQFLAADTDIVVCPGEENHVFPTAIGECNVVDDRGIPRLTGCSNAGCESKCADANGTMAAIRFENVRIEQSLSVSDRDQATTDRLVQEMREAHERESHWQWERENGPARDRQSDRSSAMKEEEELKQKVQQVVDRTTKEASGREKRRVRWEDKMLIYRKHRVLPPGEYAVEIVKVSEARSRKTGNDMLVVLLDVKNEEGWRVTVHDFLVFTERSSWKFEWFLQAIGLKLQDGQRIDVHDFVGCTARVQLGTRLAHLGPNCVERWLPKAKDTPATTSTPPAGDHDQ